MEQRLLKEDGRRIEEEPETAELLWTMLLEDLQKPNLLFRADNIFVIRRHDRVNHRE